MNKKIYLSSPHMGGLEQQYIEEAFQTNWIAPLGSNVDAFEKEVADMTKVKYAVALSSGTAALHLGLKLLGVCKGDLVLCSSLTFAASCFPILYEGAIPVFIDSEPDSFNMSPSALEKALETYKSIKKLPKAVVIVDLYGQSADYDKLLELCKSYGVAVLEDAAEALGATYKGKYAGTLGDIGVFSFNGNKIITTSGGGMLISDNKSFVEKAKFLSTQAREAERYYEHRSLGYNYRMSNVLAGIGRGQLRVLEQRIEQKKRIYEAYREGFSTIGEIEMMPIKDYGQPNYWLSVITLKGNSKIKPVDIILALEQENIEARHIWKPMQLQPLFKDYSFFSHYTGKSSVSESLFDRGLCLPSDTKLTEKDMDRIIGLVKGLWKK